MEAARNGQADLAGILLDAGADPDARDRQGRSALYWAAAAGQAAVVELLLERKADLNLAALSGDTPLAVAAQNGYAAVVQTLLGHGADSALALDAARKSGQADAVRLLTAIAVE